MTIGVSCRPMVMSPPCAIQATESLPTLSLLIWSSGLYRQALAVRLYCGQLFGSSVPGSAASAILAVLSRQATAKPAADDALRIVSSRFLDFGCLDLHAHTRSLLLDAAAACA